METKLHPVMTVSNIKNVIPITLEVETSHYTTWSELFQVHCLAYQVFDHLQPRPPPPSTVSTVSTDGKTTTSKPNEEAEALWNRLDAIVLQWIYATISTDLLHTILTPGASAYQAWTTLENLFKDNKNVRAVQLQQEFANTRLENFSSMASYCQHIKLLSDQLTSVGAPVTNHRLVLQLLSGLTEQYDSISTILQHRDPLPDFNECRSRLTMEENEKKNQTSAAAAAAATALTATNTHSSIDSTTSAANSAGLNRGRGRHRGGGRGRNSSGRQNKNPMQQPFLVFPPNWTPNNWASPTTWNNNTHQTQPPCPYPSSPRTNNSAGILGPRPTQAYTTTYSPTDIAQALYTLALNQADNTIMDTGASNHTFTDQGPQDASSYPTM